MKKIALNSWERKEHFEFYQDFADPNFNITTNLNTHSLYFRASQADLSFTYCYLYCLARAIEHCDFMRYRIVDSCPVEAEQVTISGTFLRSDNTFRFITLSDSQNIHDFIQQSEENKKVGLEQPLMGEMFLSNCTSVEQVYVSILPWFQFSSFKHARHVGDNLGIPKIIFGKLNDDKNSLPVSIEVHHGLVDGYHISLFLDEFHRQIIALCRYLEEEKNFHRQ
ncbi:CatA-like O-acetyltransferase [Pseudoalteromonas luteoviolacea]|uniref:CatA-like O-acetyltransferase n=1 Tax=Pseudoalteromonas luteoviolacea TaxID=43657 RepID=UPI0011538279|nr:CatA-like O-acetyltransferase [Pseudoalteromonas luteoviolacea]TQF71531.1 chloramphenicol acetyltransferase [Pseudoalteromonas luteoviolacea]